MGVLHYKSPHTGEWLPIVSGPKGDQGLDGNTTVLSGTATPTNAVGNEPNYYFDIDDHILYGPKGKVTESFITSARPTLNQEDSADRERAMRFKTLTTGKVIALKFYRSPVTSTAPAPTSRKLSLWSDAGTLLTSATTSSEPTAGGWITATLSTPYNLAANTYYRVSHQVPAYTMYSHGDNTPSASTSFSDLKGYVSVGGFNVFPNQGLQNTLSTFTDVVFEPSVPNEWPVALNSVPTEGLLAPPTGRYWKTVGSIPTTTYPSGSGGLLATIMHNAPTNSLILINANIFIGAVSAAGTIDIGVTSVTGATLLSDSLFSTHYFPTVDKIETILCTGLIKAIGDTYPTFEIGWQSPSVSVKVDSRSNLTAVRLT